MVRITGCRSVRPRLSAHLDNALPDGERIAVTRHIAHCPACRAERMEIEAVRDQLRHLPGPSREQSNRARQRALSRLDAALEPRTPRRPRRRRGLLFWTLLLPAIATGSAGIALALPLYPITAPLPTPGELATLQQLHQTRAVPAVSDDSSAEFEWDAL